MSLKGSESIDEEKRVDVDADAEFGGPEGRQRLEKKLLLKLDLRMSMISRPSETGCCRTANTPAD